MHRMRTCIITSPGFNGDRILGAILFENTMDSDIQGRPTADYLWTVKRIVPFLKVDHGLAEEKNGVRLMKPMPQLAPLLKKATSKGIFGTKMRSVIKKVNLAGIRDIVDQQFELAAQILAAGLVPIVEPEVDIDCPERSRAEAFLKSLYSKNSTGCLPDNWSSSNLRCRKKTICTLISSNIPRWRGCLRFREVTRGTKPTRGCAGITASSRASRGPWSRD